MPPKRAIVTTGGKRKAVAGRKRPAARAQKARKGGTSDHASSSSSSSSSSSGSNSEPPQKRPAVGTRNQTRPDPGRRKPGPKGHPTESTSDAEDKSGANSSDDIDDSSDEDSSDEDSSDDAESKLSSKTRRKEKDKTPKLTCLRGSCRALVPADAEFCERCLPRCFLRIQVWRAAELGPEGRRQTARRAQLRLEKESVLAELAQLRRRMVAARRDVCQAHARRVLAALPAVPPPGNPVCDSLRQVKVPCARPVVRAPPPHVYTYGRQAFCDHHLEMLLTRSLRYDAVRTAPAVQALERQVRVLSWQRLDGLQRELDTGAATLQRSRDGGRPCVVAQCRYAVPDAFGTLLYCPRHVHSSASLYIIALRLAYLVLAPLGNRNLDELVASFL